MPDLPFQGAIKLRNIKGHTNIKDLIAKGYSSSNYKRGRYSTTRNSQEEDKTESMSNEDSMIVHAYFAKMPRMQEDNMGYTEYLHAAHDLQSTKKNIRILQSIYQTSFLNQNHYPKY